MPLIEKRRSQWSPLRTELHNVSLLTIAHSILERFHRLQYVSLLQLDSLRDKFADAFPSTLSQCDAGGQL